MEELVFSPSDFVAVLNQTLEYAYPLATIEGEMSNVRVSRGKWVYFDIKDELASVKCFGTVYMLPGPLEDGMMVRIVASPRMHPLYNFSLNIQSIKPIGEGSLKRASDLLFKKLTKEGLFEEARKRLIPYAPETIGLVASKESAAYADFIKILNARWCGVQVSHTDVQVQGEPAVADIVNAISVINQMPSPPEVIVITRGGGSVDDLSAFSTEQVVRAIATSRIPTLVAIGHEVDISLAELTADKRASTPSNAAELLVPDKQDELNRVKQIGYQLLQILGQNVDTAVRNLAEYKKTLNHFLSQVFELAEQIQIRKYDLLQALNPEAALKRGYAVIRSGKAVVKSIKNLKEGSEITLQLQDGSAQGTINKVNS